jgi:hypothetical protein
VAALVAVYRSEGRQRKQTAATLVDARPSSSRTRMRRALRSGPTLDVYAL